MNKDTHCPNCFREPVPKPACQHCGFDVERYEGETNENHQFSLWHR